MFSLVVLRLELPYVVLIASYTEGRAYRDIFPMPDCFCYTHHKHHASRYAQAVRAESATLRCAD